MKRLLFAAVLLVGCDDASSGAWSTQQRPLGSVPGLEDCSYVHASTPLGMPDLHVIRCPNSSTTTTWSERRRKTTVTRTAVVVDGGTP